jgi:hypothetical protein
MLMLCFWFAVLLLLAVFLITALISLLIATFRGAPYVPVPASVSRRMAELTSAGPGDKAIDLGSGDGRIVIDLARHGALAEGYEIQPLLVWWSRWRAWRVGLRQRTVFRHRDLWSADCSGAKAVTLYAFPSMMARLEEKLQRELPVGARVVSLSFVFPTWPPIYDDGKIRVYEKRDMDNVG